MKCQYCHEFGNTKEQVVKRHEKWCSSRPQNRQRSTARPEFIKPVPIVPAPSDPWLAYIAQDHKPAEWNPSKAGKAWRYDYYELMDRAA